MTIEDKIISRYRAVCSNKGVKPIGLVLDRGTYQYLKRQPPWDTLFKDNINTNDLNGDRYCGLLVSVAETQEETIIVY